MSKTIVIKKAAATLLLTKESSRCETSNVNLDWIRVSRRKMYTIKLAALEIILDFRYSATTATATIRDVIRSEHSSLVAFERVLLNAYYIEDLKYVNRRLSIPSGLFSPPTEESTFDPRTQPTSPPLVFANDVREALFS